MRGKHAWVLASGILAVLAFSSAARPQDDGLAHYWPHRTVGIPVSVEQINRLPNRPSELQLYYAVNRGAFQKGPRLSLNKLHPLDGGKEGFLFTADRDGDFEFTVQFVYPDGSVSPKVDELSPQRRVIIDTTPPLVRLYASQSGVEWSASDDNLDPREVSLECKWPTSREWTKVTDRAFRTTDQYAWKLPPGKVLEVRVVVRDRAGNEGVSTVVRVPPDGASGAGLTRPTPGGGPDWVGGSPANLPQPRIDYVNTLDFQVDYSIQRMGRSGIQAAHLFVLRNQGGWELVKRFETRVMPGDEDKPLSLPYKAKEEGTYGFYIIPESGAGNRAPDPKRDDQPMLYVVVDTTPPYIKITGVQVKKGGTRGPLVEITWEAADPNLMPQPVSLEWSTDKEATKWNEIKYRLGNIPNSTMGRFTWEVPDEKLWKFWVRARAVDKASNTGEHIWPQEVIVDLEQPAAGIIRAKGGNSPPDTTPPPSGKGGSDLPLTPGTGGLPSLPKLPGG